MARLKVLLLLAVALGLVFWTLHGGADAPRAAAAQADAQLARLEKGFVAASQAQPAHQRAVAAELTHHAAVLGALAKVAAKGQGPTLEDAPAFKAALEQALAQLPEADRAYAAAALATPGGAVAVVPGHDPIAATSFAWLDAALNAGAAGQGADVAGRSVWVYAAPVSTLANGKVETVGTLAVAYARDDAALQALADGFAPLTLVSGGKVLATSDKPHADAAAQLTAPGSKVLALGQPAAFLGVKLPLAPAPLVQARAFAVPGRPGLLAVATADLGPAVASAAEVEQRGLTSLLVLLLVGGVVTALTWSPAKSLSADAWDEPQPAPLAPTAAAVPEPSATAAAAPAEEPEPIVASETVSEEPAAPPPSPAPAAPPPVPASAAPPAAPADDGVPGFDELFGKAPPARPAPSGPAQAETRAALATAPPAPKAAPPAPAKDEPERTGLMSRDMLSVLAAQSSIPQQDSGAIPLPGSARAPVPLPAAGGAADSMERTSVSAVPLELLRAATRPAAPAPISAEGSEEAHFQEVYRDFMQTRERCGEPPENLTFEKFAAKLRKNKEQLVQKYNCKSVRFQVYVKEGKAALKATPVKDA